MDHIITSMVIGFIAGVLAARVLHVPGFGVLGDVALGLAGALISAISALLAGVGHGVITSIVVAFFAAFVGTVLLAYLLVVLTEDRGTESRGR
jgi:uncharacterized membrane protein YeaQ/YmgE (transglycosylase-associated protein family)